MTTARQQAVIVGAGPGLGRSLALRLASEGFDIALLARDEDRLQPLAEQIRATSRSARTMRCDAADPNAVAAAVSQLAGAAPIGVLVYNAAARGARLIDTDVDTLRSAMNVNALSAIAAVHAALPSLERTRGAVLFTGGGLALRPNAAAGVLSLGKVALRTVALLLAEDLAPRGVRVHTLTIADFIVPDGPFDPDAIAKAFWTLRTDPHANVEQIFTGSDPR